MQETTLSRPPHIAHDFRRAAILFAGGPAPAANAVISAAAVSFLRNDIEVIGVLNCFTVETHIFSETEVNLITTVANQAAVAIMNTELMVKTRVIEEELETRKMVERAKEVLMQKRNKTGEEAYQWIRKRSMDTRKSMRTVAEAVLLSEELE